MGRCPVVSLALLAGCMGSTQEPAPPMAGRQPEPIVMHQAPPPPEPAGGAGGAPSAPPSSAGGGGGGSASAGRTGDAPEISRSVGAEGGVVVFWPRIIPRDAAPTTRELAAALQTKLRAIVERTLPGRPVDVRPEPERVCPRVGCSAMTVGVLLHRNQTGCIAVALVSGPGTAPAKLVPWGGVVRLRSDSVPFREAPETQVTVADYAACAGFVEHGQLLEREPDVVAAIRAAQPR